jgi:hypothetical protein
VLCVPIKLVHSCSSILADIESRPCHVHQDCLTDELPQVGFPSPSLPPFLSAEEKWRTNQLRIMIAHQFEQQCCANSLREVGSESHGLRMAVAKSKWWTAGTPQHPSRRRCRPTDRMADRSDTIWKVHRPPLLHPIVAAFDQAWGGTRSHPKHPSRNPIVISTFFDLHPDRTREMR